MAEVEQKNYQTIMIETVILLAPSIFCLIWGLINVMSSARTYRYWIFSLLMFTATLYLYSETFLFAGLDSKRALMISDFVYRFAALILPTVIMLYSRRVAFHKYHSNWIAILLILSIILVTIIAYTASLIGTDNCIKFYNDKSRGIDIEAYHSSIYTIHYTLTFPIYRIYAHGLYICTFAYIIFCLIKRGVNWQMIIKFLKGEKMERHNLQLLFIIIFTLFIYTRFFLKRAFLNDYTIASCSVSLILCIIVLIVGYVEVFVKMPMIQATAILHPIEVITVPEPVNENTEKRLEVDLSISKKFLDNQSKFSEMFEDLMEKQHYYTTKGLTLDDVAKSMQTNKTYISLLVNNIYKKSFPDYINSKRVEFAKKLLKESKGSMKMEEIADKSGFQSTAQLARKVKEIEGLTLREWITIANQIKN